MNRKPTLLVVDDDPGIRRLIERIFREDFRVRAGADAADGFALAHECGPALIILDAKMPGTDGYQLATMLRESRATRAVPILMATGYGGEEAAIESGEVGIDDFIEKPFAVEELRARVADMIGSLRPARALAESAG